MCFTLLVIMSIATLLVFVRFDKIENDAILSLTPGTTFTFSWLVTVVLLTTLVETWQIVLSIPTAVREPTPAWDQIIESLLRTAVYLLPVGRVSLAALYALPLLLVPSLVIVVKRLAAGPALLYSALVNPIFFWLHLILDNGIPSSATKIPIQGLILVITYTLVLYLLIWQRPVPLKRELIGAG